jgi:hypothetical protein
MKPVRIKMFTRYRISGLPIKPAAFILLSIILWSGCRPEPERPLPFFSGKPEIPASILNEHEYLLGRIHRFTLFNDSTGVIAKKVEELMQHHFNEEEGYALPPLGLLPSLANGQWPEQIKEILLLTEKLKSQLVHLDVEHQLIKAYMNELKQSAVKDEHPEVLEFEKELLKHANLEEQVLFPATLLIGEHLKLHSGISH